MDKNFRALLIFLFGLAALGAALALSAVYIHTPVWTWIVGAIGIVGILWGGVQLRQDFGTLFKARRGQIAAETLGIVGALVAIAYLATLYPLRADLTEARMYSLSTQTIDMLKRLDKPVRVTFFHDPMMRETVELYEQMARQTDKLKVDYFDPVTNPAQARMMGVQFPGTSVMESEGRKLQVQGGSETDIGNGILRISQGATQTVCFLEGHGEADAFSLESHDHQEGDSGHSHGFGSKLVVHESHGMAKAKNALEAMNYTVRKVSLLQRKARALDECAVLIVAGPKTALLSIEVEEILRYLNQGGNALLMMDPFVKTGLDPIVNRYSIQPDDDIVIDDASHFWADPSAPAITDYNRHQITRDLPMTFYPGARSLSPTAKRTPGSNVVPLANASLKSYGETDPSRAAFDEKTDNKGPRTLAVVASRRPPTPGDKLVIPEGLPDNLREAMIKQKSDGDNEVTAVSRLVVFGDSDFATNSFFHILGNGKMFLNVVNYLAAKENLIGLQPRTFDIPRVNLTNLQIKGTVFLSIVLVPALLALIGLAVWWKQR